MRQLLSTLADLRRLAAPYFVGDDRWPGRLLLVTIIGLELDLAPVADGTHRVQQAAIASA